MKHICLLITPLLILTSCATLFNKNTQKIYLISETDSITFIVNNSDTLSGGKQQTEVNRGSKPLNIRVISPDQTEEINIKSQLDPLFVLGNGVTYGLGWFFDLPSKKKYEYEQYNLFYYDGKKLVYKTPSRPLTFFLGFEPVGQIKIHDYNYNFSFNFYGGYIFGGELYLKEDLFLSSAISGGFNSNMLIKNFSYDAFIINWNWMLKKEINRFNAGIGINIQSIDIEYWLDSYFSANFSGLGSTIELQYRLFDEFYASATYNATFYNINTTGLLYNAVFGIGIIYKAEFMNFDQNRFRQLIK